MGPPATPADSVVTTAPPSTAAPATQPAATQPSGGALPKVATEADYDAIKPGDKYVGPDGLVRTKVATTTP